MSKRSCLLALSSLVLSGSLLGCASDEPEDPDVAARKRCSSLRDRVIDLRVASATDVDQAAHRAAMRDALGDRYIDECVKDLSPSQIDCAMKAADTDIASACVRK